MRARVEKMDVLGQNKSIASRLYYPLIGKDWVHIGPQIVPWEDIKKRIK